MTQPSVDTSTSRSYVYIFDDNLDPDDVSPVLIDGGTPSSSTPKSLDGGSP